MKKKMCKTYRCFVDVMAGSKEEANTKVLDVMGCAGPSVLSGFRIQEDPFNDEEEGIILELAREALSDADVFDLFATKLDLSDKELKALQEKIEAITDRP